MLKRIRWTVTHVTEHQAVVKIPDGVDLADYDLGDAVAQLAADAPENGVTREVKRSVFSSHRISGNAEGDPVEELNLEGYKWERLGRVVR